MENTELICQSTENENSTLYMWNIWNQHKPYNLYSEHYLQGYSWAAHRTTFIIKSLNVQFDAGVSLTTGCENIFITHFHGDHVGFLRFDITNPKIKLFVGIEYIEKVKNFLIMYHSMIDPFFDPNMFKFQIIGVKEGDQHELCLGGKKFMMKVYKSYHSVECFSYGFEEISKTLKNEFKGLSGKELGILRKNNIQIEELKIIPRFIYVGDTSELIYENTPDIFTYPIIITECTFLDDCHLEQSIKTKHSHYLNLKSYVEKNSQSKFILYHFSLRYKSKYIKQFFDENHFSNVYPWISN